MGPLERGKQAGRAGRGGLCERLAKRGYRKTATDGLFKHDTQDISFTLAVGDFGITAEKTKSSFIRMCLLGRRAWRGIPSRPRGTVGTQ